MYRGAITMKKKNIINLIKYYSEHNDAGFRSEAYEIAKFFDKTGDYQLAEYIMALMSDANTFVPQMDENNSSMLEKIDYGNEGLWLPDIITQDLLGIVNAVAHKAGINRFMFQGSPGTGKTEAVKQLARILERDIYMVDFAAIIDSKLGQTQKNISNFFKEINNFVHPEKVMILFDEIDALALDRTNSNDLREMGRATSSLLKGLDYLDERIVLVATTNLYQHFDKALLRRFDSVIDFDRYNEDDLVLVAEELLNKFLTKFKLANKDVRLFRKIINLMNPIPFPGDIKNLIRISVAFSDPEDGHDYFRRLYYAVNNEKPEDLVKLQRQKFTLREIEILTKIPKSTVGRELKELETDE
jgi:SpoVK/Ycf46/Vps4 family AAA+-type ATPase